MISSYTLFLLTYFGGCSYLFRFLFLLISAFLLTYFDFKIECFCNNRASRVIVFIVIPTHNRHYKYTSGQLVAIFFHVNNSLKDVNCMTIHYGILMNCYCILILFTASKTIGYCERDYQSSQSYLLVRAC